MIREVCILCSNLVISQKVDEIHTLLLLFLPLSPAQPRNKLLNLEDYSSYRLCDSERDKRKVIKGQIKMKMEFLLIGL